MNDEQKRWFKFWQQAVATQHGVMGVVAGLTVTALAVVVGFASTGDGFNELETGTIIFIAILLSLHVMWLIETVKNDREASFLSWTGRHYTSERERKSLRNNELYHPMQHSLLLAWVLVLVLIIMVIE
ncbi:MAG: hypothetical protein ABH826_04845 [Patescibacteria group bacterium]